MITFGQFAQRMETAALMAHPRAAAVLFRLVESVAQEAKGYIGHELPTWPPLAPSTIEQKTKLGYVGRVSATDPLLRAGEMRKSIQATVHGLTGVVGSPLRKALWQEMGTVRPTGSIPPRPFLGLAMSRSHHQADIFFGALAVSLLTGARP